MDVNQLSLDGAEPPVSTDASALTNQDLAVSGKVVDNTTGADDNPATDLTDRLVGDSPTRLTFNADCTWSFDTRARAAQCLPAGHNSQRLVNGSRDERRVS